MRLQTRLLLATVAVIVAALTIAGTATYLTFRSAVFADLDQSLREVSLPLGDRDERADRVPMPAISPFVEVRAPDGTVLTRVPTVYPDGREVAPDLPTTISTPGVSNSADGPATFFTATGDDTTFRVKASTNGAGEQLIIAVPIDAELAILRQLAVIQVAVGVVALVVASVLGWALVRFGLRPLTRLTRQVRNLGPAGSTTRVDVSAPQTEVGELGTVLNTKLDETSAAIAQQAAVEAGLRRFVADASHELRTPIAAVSAYAELFELGAAQRPDDLQRAMVGISRETARMRDLTAALLALARLDDQQTVAYEWLDLAVLTHDAVEAAAVVDPTRPIRLMATAPVGVIGDPTGLRQVLDNLLGNARTHTPPGTQIVVGLTSTPMQVMITVADDGPGLGAEHFVAMFERFWRADTARSRTVGGNGLGLAIVAAIVATHGGSVSATHSSSGGLQVTVALPAA